MEENKLPQELKNALGSSENFDKLCKIAENFGIEGSFGEGANKLDKIFEKTFTGNLTPDNVFEEIKRTFGFSDELSNDIAAEMNSQIFSNYKEGLNELYQKKMPTISTSTKEPVEEKKPEEKEEPAATTPSLTEKEEKLSSLEKELLKEAQMPKEDLAEPETVKPGTEDEIDDVLGKLSKELEKEKGKREALNKIFKDKNEA